MTLCEGLSAGRRIRVATSLPVCDFAIGESIAISGACMTVVEAAAGQFAVEVSAESLRRTTLGQLQCGDRVNLERALLAGDRLGGHIVSGHVDGVGVVDAIRPEGESSIFTFRIDPSLMPMLAEKGSIAVDGISLTCFHLRDDRFDVAVIPHTLASTSLGLCEVATRVNLETDVLAKHVARLVESALAARLAIARVDDLERN